jgi:formate hydrogenlyase subunit 3/multisubunit Na+/H+ antiporter MnhD subunit
MSALFAIAIGCFILGALVDLIFGVASKYARPWPYLLALAGSACLVLVGVHATTFGTVSVDLGTFLGIGHSALLIDQLAGYFLTLMFAIAAAVSVCLVSWVHPDDRRQHRGTASGYLLLLGAAAVIVCAADAFLFLFAWELLTFAFYVLTSLTRSSARQTGAAWSTMGMGKVSGAALLFGFLLLAGHTGSLTIAGWHAVGPGALLDVAWVLVVAGFAAKLGVVPFQVWIPIGYPAAPGPTRAAMAGIAANVGVYGLWRFLGVLEPPPVWLVIIVLLVGGFTALLGITFAGVQSSLSRVVAYSSIENAGLIVTAYGVALTGDVLHSSALVAVGLLAATLQTTAHAIAKSALFVSLANFEAVEGTDDLDRLRGVGRRMPWSGVTFAAGALTLAGLPPTIGFVSEWFILEALMQQFRVGGLALRLGLVGAAAMVALTTGLGALVFLRLLALTILGKANPELERRREFGVFNKIGLTVLGVGCLALAALSPLEVRYIADGLSPVVAKVATMQALTSPWVLQPVFSGFSILSPSWLWVILASDIALVFLMTLLLSRGQFLRVRRVPAWRSATSGVEGPSNYTSFGFANPLRHVLANLLGTRRTVDSGHGNGDEGFTDGHSHVATHTTVVEPVETYLYRPLRSSLLQVSRTAKRLQSGRLNVYVAYMLLALLAALAIVDVFK